MNFFFFSFTIKSEQLQVADISLRQAMARFIILWKTWHEYNSKRYCRTHDYFVINNTYSWPFILISLRFFGSFFFFFIYCNSIMSHVVPKTIYSF